MRSQKTKKCRSFDTLTATFIVIGSLSVFGSCTFGDSDGNLPARDGGMKSVLVAPEGKNARQGGSLKQNDQGVDVSENTSQSSLTPVKKIIPPRDTCHITSALVAPPPVYLADKGIVVTRILKNCISFDGRKGFEEDSPWMAMGLPCTGGAGRIDWKGHFYNPKLVSFILSTDCTMMPSHTSAVKMAGESSLGLSRGSTLLAYNPFAVQYWEIPGLKDADIGFTVDLRSVEAKQRVWRNFLDEQPIPVRLYGRENAWVMGDHFYFVQAELVKTGTYTFRLNVKDVKAMTDAEIQQVKANCEALRPARKCHQVFKI